jgi:flagellar biosynthesis protein FlhF
VIPERLREAGFSKEIAADIAAGAARRSGSADLAIVEELTSRIPTAPFVEMQPGESRTLAFVGPPGRGKTISLVKIAVNMGLARRVPVRIYCAGAHGIGAREQAARLAEILGTPFQACESLTDLNFGGNGEAWNGLTLIDTPGISPADRDELSELKDFFAARPEIEKHLVLRADASSADMLHMVSRFSGLAPSRLLFTGMDETIGAVSTIETLIRAEIPATFAGTGQQIPKDLEEVNAGWLARAVWATDEKPVQAAAA